MIKPRAARITVRPNQPLSLLAITGFIAAGLISAWKIYGAGAAVFTTGYVLLTLGFLLDRVVWDGAKLERSGPGAALLALFGYRTVIGLDEIEAVTSTSHSGLRFTTTVNGPDTRWTFKSKQPGYHRFIKSLLKALHPQQLDPLSTELLYYWQEAEPQLPLVKEKVLNKYRIERWRRKGISLSFQASYEAAYTYLKMALDAAPTDPQIAYDMGRFLRRRAASAGEGTAAGIQDLANAERYFRLAGTLASEARNPRLLEKVGESFLESRHHISAGRYFEMATAIEPTRPRANIGIANLALLNGQAARAIFAYDKATWGASEADAKGLAAHAARKREYFERLLKDDSFLDKEASWRSVLEQLKWARRFTFGLFLAGWVTHLIALQSNIQVREISRELSATALVMWVFAMFLSQVIHAYRRQD